MGIATGEPSIKDATRVLHEKFGLKRAAPSTDVSSRATVPGCAHRGVSPLLALIKDQVDALLERGIAAATLNSTQTTEDAHKVQDDLRSNAVRILYVSPERFKNTRFIALMRRTKLALLAVDEAHCVSEWGHSFRPDYLRLAVAAAKLPFTRVLALTATATPAVAH
eukprot:IDg14385t1